MKYSSILRIATLIFTTVASGPVLAVSLNTAPAIKQAQPLFGTRLKPVRVRIGVDYAQFEAMLFKNKEGKAYYKSVARGQKFHTLRTRLEQRNQFYFNGLHVETLPLHWNKESRRYKVRMEFYRTYGHNGSLEDRLGSLDVEGILQGKGRVLNFIGEGRASFKNTRGIKIAEFRVGTPRNLNNPPPRISQAPKIKK